MKYIIFRRRKKSNGCHNPKQFIPDQIQSYQNIRRSIHIGYNFDEGAKMSEEQIALLEKALSLYAFTIEQRKDSNSDVYESNEIYFMVEELSRQIGHDLDY